MITYNNTTIDGLNIFYRAAGSPAAPTIVLLHGFPSSSHMFRDLIPQLADRFYVIAPDLPGFGYSAAPDPANFNYTFESLSNVVTKLLFDVLNLNTFALYVQDYGAPVGFRIASRNPEAITGLIIQNGNAYLQGISPAFEPLKPFWANRTAETELPARGLLTADTTKFQYLHGAANPAAINPDSYTFDQHFLDRPGNNAIQLDLFHNYPSNLALYDQWHQYFRTHQPKTLIVWGQHDPFFTPEGAKAFLTDLPNAELHLLNTGHFALEEQHTFIAQRIQATFAN